MSLGVPRHAAPESHPTRERPPARKHRVSLRIGPLISAIVIAFGVWAIGISSTGIGSEGIGTAGAAPAAPDFVGKTYSSTTVTGTQIPGGGPLEVSFPAANRIALSAGCNRHVGEMRVEGSALRLSSLASTMMACPGPQGDADGWITRFTQEPLTWYSVGQALVLVGSGSQVLLTENYS
ncbi:META domain-containing protein [Gordonia jinghuaiqii]|uniref:META domain-containing protein n=1 Tax=Gordonia jinghuaiqii TaxID=2758710 RepID=UPI001FD326CD|nr:META domain-containing protein [Gordonia jinghuaiqii]